MSITRIRRSSIGRVLPFVGLLLACGGSDEGPPAFRGPGLKAVALDVDQQAAINAAAVGAAFDPDPNLSLLLDTVYLPRSEGRVGGTPMPPALVARMRQRGIVRGTCEPPREEQRTVPLCEARLPGYVVRFSEILRRGTGQDSVQVYLAATRYRHEPNAPAELLSFERAYQLARARGQWRVTSEARIPNPR